MGTKFFFFIIWFEIYWDFYRWLTVRILEVDAEFLGFLDKVLLCIVL